jgi:hypothetical protein
LDCIVREGIFEKLNDIKSQLCGLDILGGGNGKFIACRRNTFLVLKDQ